MDEIRPVPNHVLRRLPGLFRRWELAQVIEAGKDYHVEDAGSACDGTTLYAVYVSAAVAAEAEIEKDAELPSRPGSTLRGTGWARRKSRAAAQGARPGERTPTPDAIPPMKAAQ